MYDTTQLGCSSQTRLYRQHEIACGFESSLRPQSHVLVRKARPSFSARRLPVEASAWTVDHDRLDNVMEGRISNLCIYETV